MRRGGLEDRTHENIIIPDDVKTILSFGPKFVIPYKKYTTKDILKMIIDTERIWEKTPVYERKNNILIWKDEILKNMEYVRVKYNHKQKEILKMVKFMEQNSQLIILEADKGKKTAILEIETFVVIREKFMQAALMKGIYKLVGEANQNEIRKTRNRNMTNLRRRKIIWKENVILRDRSAENCGKENKIWNRIIDVEDQIPEMNFVIKTNKVIMSVRNICPKNTTATYEVRGYC